MQSPREDEPSFLLVMMKSTKQRGCSHGLWPLLTLPYYHIPLWPASSGGATRATEQTHHLSLAFWAVCSLPAVNFCHRSHSSVANNQGATLPAIRKHRPLLNTRVASSKIKWKSCLTFSTQNDLLEITGPCDVGSLDWERDIKSGLSFMHGDPGFHRHVFSHSHRI